MENLAEILDQLSHTITTSIANANARADAAQAKLNALAELFANDNPSSATPVTAADIAEPVAVIAAPASRKRGGAKYPDAMFIDALGAHWQSVSEVVVRLLAQGHKVSRNTVVSRLRDLAAAGDIEADDTGHKVRLITSAPAPDDIVASEKGKVAAKSVRKVSATKATVVSAANEDDTPGDMPASPENYRSPTLHRGCGLAMMRSLPDRSVDLVLADLPYGSTGNGFDPKIDIDEWMREMARLVTERGAIVAFASLDFTRAVMVAGHNISPTFQKDRIIWEKPKATGHQLLRHMQAHEDVLVFSHASINRNARKTMVFNPQGVVPKLMTARAEPFSHLNTKPRAGWAGSQYMGNSNWPRSIMRYGKDNEAKGLHPFAKPINLLEYLIRTYSNDNALIIDPTMGSGSAAIAAINTGRRFIGAENGTDRNGRDIFSIAETRVSGAMAKDVA